MQTSKYDVHMWFILANFTYEWHFNVQNESKLATKWIWCFQCVCVCRVWDNCRFGLSSLVKLIPVEEPMLDAAIIKSLFHFTFPPLM